MPSSCNVFCLYAQVLRSALVLHMVTLLLLLLLLLVGSLVAQARIK